MAIGTIKTPELILQNITSITNASGTIRYMKRNGVVTMSIDVTPSAANTNITWVHPEEFYPANSIYNRWIPSGSNACYLYFYGGSGTVTLQHTASAAISYTLTYVAKTM